MQIRLETPTAGREEEFLDAVHRSRKFLRRWVDPPACSESYARYVRRLRRSNHEGHFVSLVATGELVGVINLNEIGRQASLEANLGYYGFLPHVGHGYMHEGLTLVLQRAFGELRLDRVEANIQPKNSPSIALVRRFGFRRDGFAPRYLKIGGRWRDHERWALRAEQWRDRSYT